MSKTKRPSRPHVARPLLRRDPDTRFVDTSVVAECDTPNDRELVDPLKRSFVEPFFVVVRDERTEPPTIEAAQTFYRDVETGADVPADRVCKRCVKARGRRALGGAR